MACFRAALIVLQRCTTDMPQCLCVFAPGSTSTSERAACVHTVCAGGTNACAYQHIMLLQRQGFPSMVQCNHMVESFLMLPACHWPVGWVAVSFPQVQAHGSAAGQRRYN